MTTTPPPGPTRTPRGFGIDPRLGEATLRVPAASKEDSRPQTILKFHRPSSLDYRARHGLLVTLNSFRISVIQSEEKNNEVTRQIHSVINFEVRYMDNVLHFLSKFL